jgi:hypothetical protein
MDPQKVESISRRIQTINASIKKAESFQDGKAFCNVEGEDKVYTVEQLNELLKKEEQSLRALAQ